MYESTRPVGCSVNSVIFRVAPVLFKATLSNRLNNQALNNGRVYDKSPETLDLSNFFRINFIKNEEIINTRS
jgi:hypothetical protein